MSVNEQPPSADTTISHHASERFASDLEDLDRRLKRLSDDVLPLHPYLFTLPTNAPFRLSSRSMNNWAVGRDRPFNPEEQQLQYTTFLTHHDTDSLLVAVGDWADETGRIMIDQSTAPSSTETPKESVAKKKISLKDYKTQKTSGIGTPPTVHDQRHRDEPSSGNRDAIKQYSKVVPADTNNKAEPLSSSSQVLHPPEKGPRKRPSASDIERIGSQATKDSDMHSPKKPRLSPEKDSRKEIIPPNSQSPSLPALLSPTLPPTKIPLSPTLPPTTRLPRLLSPTLPPDLEKELARFEKRSPVHASPRHGITTSESRRDDAIRSRTPISANSNGNSNSSSQINRVGASLKDSSLAQQQLLVRLRYGKTNRRRVEALLKFSGERKAQRSISPPDHDGDNDCVPKRERKKEDAGSNRAHATSNKMKPGMKHDIDAHEYSGPHSKDPRASTEKPLTPAAHDLPAAHDKIKPTSLTPGKDSKSSTVRRNDFVEVGGKTPANPTNKRRSVDPTTKDSPSQPECRPRNNERRAWRDESQKFSNTGRELKHAAERYMNGASATDEKLAVVTAIEAILCFILAFVAEDQAKVLARQVGDSSTWVSILAYWRVVRKNSALYPVLHSLCLLLGAVSYDAIHALDLDRLANSPLPSEHTPVPTPGSDGITVPSGESRKSRKEFLDLKSRLPECYKESQRLWLEGTRTLSEDVLTREYPITWSQRSHNYAERGKAPLKVGDYTGDYFLPLGGTTPPIEVVRFGCSLLKEWCTRENVEWKRRLSL